MSLEAFDGARVVVVDDNLPSAQLVQRLLARAGLPPVTAVTDPREFVERFDALTPHLVILDLHMPGLDGYGVLAELRRRIGPADLPVLVLTADTTRQATHRALELGANDFLTKPLDAAELVLRVRNLLEARALHVGLIRRHRWLEASARLAGDLLAGASTEPLRRVCELAHEAAAADFAVLTVGAAAGRPTPGNWLWVGEGTDAAADAIATAFADIALRTDSPALLDELPNGPVGPLIVVPLPGRDRLLGALVIARHRGGEPFLGADLSLAQGFADQAAVAVELAEARAEQARMLVLSDRHRIARDLHDQVIQRLFATGLRLQQLADQVGAGQLADQIGEHVSDLDDTITEIRSTIFGLRQPGSVGADRLPIRLSELVEELADILGFRPQLWLDAPLDAVDQDLADDLVLATREALTNVARHAGAHGVRVTVSLADGDIVLVVQDDGVGVGAAGRRSGLINLYERARRHGGTCRVSLAPGGGTSVEWRARLAFEPVALPAG